MKISHDHLKFQQIHENMKMHNPGGVDPQSNSESGFLFLRKHLKNEKMKKVPQNFCEIIEKIPLCSYFRKHNQSHRLLTTAKITTMVVVNFQIPIHWGGGESNH